MILESIIIIGLAILLDLVLGDPKNRYHPTVWIGNLIGTITTRMKNENQNSEKFGGIFIVLIPVSVSIVILLGLQYGIDFINIEFLSILVSIISGIILFKMTIAIKGMERHALSIFSLFCSRETTVFVFVFLTFFGGACSETSFFSFSLTFSIIFFALGANGMFVFSAI